jgi:glyoxylase-like metal-dependent hydrolase (beta-lactamase superfamily II)
MGPWPETARGKVIAMALSIHKYATGPLETNTYLVEDGSSCIVVDPSAGCQAPLSKIAREKLSVSATILTHCHFDHILGIGEILAAHPAAVVWAHPAEKPLLTNAEFNGSYLIGRPTVYDGPVSDLSEGKGISIGGLTFDVLHVPGHSPGGCALVFRDAGTTSCLSGDALFAGSIGRYDFPLGDGPLLIRSIREKLLTLPDDTVVYPGHGGRTTIAREKRMNPYVSGDAS